MSNEKSIDIHCFGMNQELFQFMFPQKSENLIENDYGNIEKRIKIIKINNNENTINLFIPLIILFFTKYKKMYWNGYNYPELLESNNKKIILDLYKKITLSENKNIIIIKFGNSYLKEFSTLINKIQKDKPFILFIYKRGETYNPEEFKNFKNPEFISHMNYDDNKQNLFNKISKRITSYIWDKQNYFFEFGKIHELFTPKTFIECNILLTGESRAGKSSFINRVFNKFVTHEGANLESLTNKIKEYTYYLKNKNNKKNGIAGINFIDTPGIIKKSDFKLIKKELDKYFKRIDIIYFFIKAQSNLEYCVEMLEYIKEKNKSMVKKGRNKIPIIFIRNGEDLKISNEKPAFFQYLKDQLKKYKLFELYDNTFEINNGNEAKNEINEEMFFGDEEMAYNYDNYIEGNIIQIHLPTGKNISKIFSISKQYLYNNNKAFFDEEEMFIRKKNDTQSLINFYIKEKFNIIDLSDTENKEKNYLTIECNNFVNKMKNKCSLLYNLTIFEIKEKSGFLSLYTLIMLPFLLVSLFLPYMFNYACIKIFNFLDKSVPFISIQFGFGIKDLENYGLKKHYISFIEKRTNINLNSKTDKNNLKKDDEKETTITSKDENNEKEREKKIKENEKKMKKLIEASNSFFEQLLLYIGPIQILIKAKELSKEIFNLLENLKNRKENEWNSFKVEEI